MSEIGILGIGFRVRYLVYGDGVVICLYKVVYEVCFMLYGIKYVGLEYK